MTIVITSGVTNKWKETDLSGCYHIAETANNRPALKVRSCLGFEIFIKKNYIIIFPSERR